MPTQPETSSVPPKVDALPDKLPILPLQNQVLYPGLLLSFSVSGMAGQQVIDHAVMENQMMTVVAQRDGEVEEPTPTELFDIGTVATVTKLVKQPDGSYQVSIRAGERVRLIEFEPKGGFWLGRIKALPDDSRTSPVIEAMALNLRTQFEKVVELAGLASELAIAALNVESAQRLVYIVASNLALTLPERQTILEISDIEVALERITFYITRQLERLELGQQIQQKVKAGMDKRQREFYLREQLQAIRRELGEAGDANQEIQELTIKLEDLDMPQDARKAAEKELERLARMSPASAEYTVSSNYLDWLLEMPWETYTEDNLDIRKAAQILDEDHFNLEKVKRRILEYLAVLKLKKEVKGPILCFVGPPGVGKTSLGQSIARSLGRKFIRVSLGGLRDEAEIRGHRRTYVGALPGRIIQGLRRVGSRNPVFMLDELDKIGMDFRGDPSAALLELLDPEQNFSFVDHYLAVPFDLSKVIFIATANMLHPIPPALKDRMEVIEIAGYTQEEKLAIAKKYLLEQQLDNHGLTDENVSVTDEAILEIIRSYTREAGVRNLNRTIAALFRNVAKEIAEGKEDAIAITPERLQDILGPMRFLPEMATRSWGPGIVTGLAWNASGGDLIFIEALRTHGSGRLILTGQLGDVMKESATAALTYLRVHAGKLNIDEERLVKSDIHVHVPAGGIPKDGPSAGVAVVVALASLMSGREVRRDVAMTGEITLRGDVLPVGGIKEKMLAARRAGIREVIIPYANEKDLVDIPSHLREGMTFHRIQLISEAFDLALASSEPPSS